MNLNSANNKFWEDNNAFIPGGSGATVTVDSALSGTSENPVQNKVIYTALAGKAGTSVATTSANGLMSSTDKSHLDTVYADYSSALTALGVI